MRRMHEEISDGDVTREYQHVDAARVERVHERAPAVAVKLDVQVGEKLETHDSQDA